MEHFCCVPTEHFQWLIRAGGYIIDTNTFVFTASGYHVFVVLAPITTKHGSWVFVFVEDFAINRSNNTETITTAGCYSFGIFMTPGNAEYSIFSVLQKMQNTSLNRCTILPFLTSQIKAPFREVAPAIQFKSPGAHERE